jgi:hypothetical protein
VLQIKGLGEKLECGGQKRSSSMAQVSLMQGEDSRSENVSCTRESAGSAVRKLTLHLYLSAIRSG